MSRSCKLRPPIKLDSYSHDRTILSALTLQRNLLHNPRSLSDFFVVFGELCFRVIVGTGAKFECFKDQITVSDEALVIGGLHL